MALKNYKPVTPSRRGLVLVDRSGLHKGGPVKKLTRGKPQKAGRNHHGHITVRHRGGGHKRKYRMVDFRRRKWDMAAVVQRLEYDPNRSTFLALIKYEDGELAYILAPQRLSPGGQVMAGAKVDVQPGNAMPLDAMPMGTLVHNVEMKPGKGGQLMRAAGASAQLMGRDGDYAILRLPSGEQRLVAGRCMATVGSLSNADNSNRKLAKAGRSRWMGVRPHVRGVAMNPVDHPHGGGEGKSSGGRHPVSPWGVPTKGHRTRQRSKPSGKYIVRSRHMRRTR
ncbi:MAG: 50S ribosomal protein L2 [Hyphomicrobiales bacterium]|nr:50S ribosomal protein L2 [Hyphomicrobiales bacterium]